MNTSDIAQAKTRYKKMFNVPVSEPLSEGVSVLVDTLEAMSHRKK
jgi:hypothetical protein